MSASFSHLCLKFADFSDRTSEMCFLFSITSPYSLYSESLASFTTGDLYDHNDASGFITLFGLPLKVRAMKWSENKIDNKYLN